ncbi:MerR family transcriptional regulator [Blautia sp.]
MEYTIKDMYKQSDLTIHTVRHYCDMGLVPNLMHDKNGSRIFDEESLHWLQGAKFLRASRAKQL